MLFYFSHFNKNSESMFIKFATLNTVTFNKFKDYIWIACQIFYLKVYVQPWLGSNNNKLEGAGGEWEAGG